MTSLSRRMKKARGVLGTVRQIGLRDAQRYRNTPRGAVVDVGLARHRVHVRRGTCDLGVARTCLGGEFACLDGLFPKDWDGVIVDAGGYIGAAALAFSDMYPKARIVSIEPASENLALYRRNTEKNPNIRVIHAALCPGPSRTIELKQRKTGMAGFSVAETPADEPDAPVIDRVQTVSLADLGVALEEIGIVKLDIEGGEKALFDECAAELSQVPVLFVELHDRIVDGCEAAFRAFSAQREVIKDDGEKYLSLDRAALAAARS